MNVATRRKLHTDCCSERPMTLQMSLRTFPALSTQCKAHTLYIGRTLATVAPQNQYHLLTAPLGTSTCLHGCHTHTQEDNMLCTYCLSPHLHRELLAVLVAAALFCCVDFCRYAAFAGGSVRSLASASYVLLRECVGFGITMKSSHTSLTAARSSCACGPA